MENREIATSDDICQALQEALTSDFFQFLVKHCLKRLNNVFRIKYNFEKGIRGITIEDMIQETIESLLKEGGRN